MFNQSPQFFVHNDKEVINSFIANKLNENELKKFKLGMQLMIISRVCLKLLILETFLLSILINKYQNLKTDFMW